MPDDSTAGERYRRSPAIVCYWLGPVPVAFDCITGTRSAVSTDAVVLLSRIPHWSTARQLAEDDPSRSVVDYETLLQMLCDHGLAERQSTARDWPWQSWMPEAAFFHSATRDGNYLRDPREYNVHLRRKAQINPPPAPTKSLPGPRTGLGAARVPGTLQASLHARRTWRVFGEKPVSLMQLTAMLQHTFGVQVRRTVVGQGPIVMKTSPSGGSRHSIEAYVIASNVSRLHKGVYHYDAATNELVRCGRAVSIEKLRRTLGNQDYFMRAGAFIVMTAVVARAMWRYPFSRAYRTVLAEVGHLGQTFCLVATALKLAPFCTMAFRDTELESIIGVDGINEPALYVVGVGTRPRGRIAHPGQIPPRLRT